MEGFKTRKDIARELKISRKTLYRKLKSFGITLPAGDVSPKNQDLIYKKFGRPLSSLSREADEKTSIRFKL